MTESELHKRYKAWGIPIQEVIYPPEDEICTCPHCGGHGEFQIKEWENCRFCDGDGEVHVLAETRYPEWLANE